MHQALRGPCSGIYLIIIIYYAYTYIKYRNILDVDAVVLQTSVRLHLGVLLTVPLGEPPVLAHEDLLTSGELELGSSQGLDNLILKVAL